MEDVEAFIEEDGSLQVVRRYDLRLLLGRWRREGCGRPRAAGWPSCGCVSESVPEATFNRPLKLFFLLILTSSCVINVIIFKDPNGPSSWDYISDQTWLFGREGILPLAVLAAVVAVGTFVKRARTQRCPAPPKREEVPTVSALVQQV